MKKTQDDTFVVAKYITVKNYKIGDIVDAPLADIYWPEKRNVRVSQDYGSDKDTNALAFELRTGFNKAKGMLQACVPDGTEWSLDQLTAMRLADWQFYRDQANKSGSELDLRLLEAFEFFYVQMLNGKKEIRPVRLLGDYGFRRSKSYLKSYVAAKYPHLLGIKADEMKERGIEPIDPPSHHIFVQIMHYRSGWELRKAQLLENAVNTKKALGEGSFLTVAHEMYTAGEKQQDFRELMKVGTGQKNWWVQTVNGMAEYRKVRLYKRLLEGLQEMADNAGKKKEDRKVMTYHPGGPLDIAKLDKEILATFAKKAGMDAPSDFVVKDRKLDAEALEAYLALCHTGKRPRANPMMNRDQVLAVKSSYNPYVEVTCDGIIQGNGQQLADLAGPTEAQCCSIIFRLAHHFGDDLVEPLKLLGRYYEKVSGKSAEDVTDDVAEELAEKELARKKAEEAKDDAEAEASAKEIANEAEELVTASGRGRKGTKKGTKK